MTSRTLGNTETATFGYDAAKRPISISLGAGGALSQGYDRAGNVTSESRALTGLTGDAGNSTQYFSYDRLNRVSQANLGSSGTPCGQAAATCYAYDRISLTPPAVGDRRGRS